MGDAAVGDVVDGVVVDPVADDAAQVEEEAGEEDGEGVDVWQVGEGHDAAGGEEEGDAHGDSGPSRAFMEGWRSWWICSSGMRVGLGAG